MAADQSEISWAVFFFRNLLSQSRKGIIKQFVRVSLEY